MNFQKRVIRLMPRMAQAPESHPTLRIRGNLRLLKIFEELYGESSRVGVEISGHVYFEAGEWRLSSLRYGEPQSTEVPEKQDSRITFHTHVPLAGQFLMPPSPEDWMVNPPGVRSLVIAREGVYKFWREAEREESPPELKHRLWSVHRQICSLSEYQKQAKAYGFHFEGYGFPVVGEIGEREDDAVTE